nr:DUF1572 family protein [Changchengzhania lutea]
MKSSYLISAKKQFKYYKRLGDQTFDQLSFDELQNDISKNANSISVIVKHMVGNMLSRWTNFLTEDGEKEWRQRDSEFENTYLSKEEILTAWDKGWKTLFHTLNDLTDEHLEHMVYIRNQGHSVTEAINRQLCHYSYHVGQIVFLGKLLKGPEWQSLSIPKGESSTYNMEKFNQAKDRRHFTDDL